MTLPALDATVWRFVIALGVFLAASHAYRKLSPYFAMNWFGAGLLFGFLWAGGRSSPEVSLLPVLVFYIAAAVTKGLVETRQGLAGNHVVHVLLTAVLGAVVALPAEAVCRTEGFALVRDNAGALWGVPALGGVPFGAIVDWTLGAGLFYGAYKVLDHTGLQQGALQTVLLFAGMPFLVHAADALRAML